MQPWTSDRAKAVSNALLQGIRDYLRSAALSLDRLPPFLTSAASRVGWTNDVLVLAVDDAPNERIDVRGAVLSDMAVLAEVADAPPTGFAFPKQLKRNTIQQWPGMPPFINVFRQGAAFTSSAQWDDEGSALLLDVSFEQEDSKGVPLLRRLVPLGVLLHQHALPDFGAVQKWLGKASAAYYTALSNSAAGNRFAARSLQVRSFSTDRYSVIVLGSYGDKRRAELESARDYMSAMGYSADLIEDLPDTPYSDLEAKVRWWTLAARFCVVIDIEPSGHLLEFGYLRDQGTVLAILRREGRPSTAMLKTNPEADYNFQRVFEFKTSPLECLDAAIKWAEASAQGRGLGPPPALR